MTAGESLKAWKRTHGFSSFQLACAISIAPSSVPKLEGGYFKPSYALAERIRAVTGIRVEDWGRLTGRGWVKKHRGPAPPNFRGRTEARAPVDASPALKPHRLCQFCSCKPANCSDDSCVVWPIRLER